LGDPADRAGARSPARAGPEPPVHPSVPGAAVGVGQAHAGTATVSLAVALGSVAAVDLISRQTRAICRRFSYGVGA
jgi:hypothetical protein